MLLGNRSDMDQALYELYRKNGISHVLAISGLHVSILGLGLWKALRRCGFGICGGRRGSGSLSVLLWAHDRLRAVGGAGCGHVRALFSGSLSGPDL